MGLDGADGQVVRNFGTMISAGNASAAGDATYGNGVYVEGSNNLFYNWTGSTLTAHVIARCNRHRPDGSCR